MKEQKPVLTVYEKYKDLETKAWFRLVKVLYLLFAGCVLLTGIALTWDEKPYLSFDNERSYVKCDRDKGTQWIYPLNDNSWNLYGEFNPNETLPYYAIDGVRRTCSQDIDVLTGKTTPLPYGETAEYSKGDYELILFSKLDGSYSEWIKMWAIFFVIFFLVYKVLVEAFYYIVTGKRMFKKIATYEPVGE